MFRYFKNKKDRKLKAKSLYDGAVKAGRQAVFYTEFGVPDTVDGRFEMIALHNFILIHRLTHNGEAKLAQSLFDAFFVNMERSLREMGIGDLAVPKHMKRMMQGFNGRCRNYAQTLENKKELMEVLARNVYGTIERPKDSVMNDLADYVQASSALNSQGVEFAPINNQAQNEERHYG